MIKEKDGKDDLVKNLYRKLILVEIEKEIIKISCNLIEDEVYTIDDAVNELIKVMDLIEMEHQGMISDIRSSSLL